MRFGTEMITDDVTAVDLTGPIKTVKDGEGNTYQARAVILAMGSGYRELGLPDEKRLSGRGVSWCATCDGFFFRDKPVVVVGGGDTAMEEAMFLTRMCEKVTVVHRRDSFRASAIMAQRVLDNPKIDVVWNATVEDVERVVEGGHAQRRAMGAAVVVGGNDGEADGVGGDEGAVGELGRVAAGDGVRRRAAVAVRRCSRNFMPHLGSSFFMFG